MTKKDPLRVINEVRKSRASELDLSDMGLSSIPQEAEELTNLQSVNFARNNLKNLPAFLQRQSRLKYVDLQLNKLTSFPSELSGLKSLRSLFLSGNPLRQLSVAPEGFAQLEVLVLDRTKLGEITPQIAIFKKLRVLSLADNQLKTLPEEMGRLTNLRELDLAGNRLTYLPISIGGLKSLRELNLSSNQLRLLPKEIGDLEGLQELILSGNPIVILPKEIGDLRQLKAIYLAHTCLTTLPPEMASLTRLERLILRDDQLKMLVGQEDQVQVGRLFAMAMRQSNSSQRLSKERTIDVPPEILNQKPSEIVHYILQHQESQNKKRPLNEAKVIFVGEAGAGKTSIVKRLKNGKFDRDSKMTEGIEISTWSVASGDKRIRLNTWDFGGQEIMHATHQFFLTQRSLYALVLDSRQGERVGRLEYWLKVIQSFGGESPVIIICNKNDQNRLDLDWKGLIRKYPNIKGFARNVSCMTGEGIEELRKLIATEVAALEHVSHELLESWLEVKGKLENMKTDYISYIEFRHICIEHGVEDEHSQRILLRFLHDLGIILNFGDDPRLEDTNILNPEWVTRGVYQIINSAELFRAKGELKIDALGRILDKCNYPREKHMFVIDMMKKFELCFAFEGESEQRFLVPDLLPKEEPDTGEWDDILSFEYHYDILMDSIISRFIVRMHSYISKSTCWRNGSLLRSEDGKSKALIRADMEDMKISILVKGKHGGRRAFLEIIRAEFRKIHHTISKMQVKEKIVLPNHSNITIDYEHLVRLSEMGEETFIPEGYESRVNVRSLLEGFGLNISKGTSVSSNSRDHVADTVFLLDKLEKQARTYARNIFWTCTAIMISAILILATYTVNFGWNSIEPWTYFIGLGTVVGGYAYFAISNREISPKAIFDHFVETRKKRLCEEFGLSIE